MRRKVLMVGKETEQFLGIEARLKQEGFEVSRSSGVPERISSLDLLFIACIEIPNEGLNLPTGIPILGFRYRGQVLTKRIPEIEILDEETASCEDVVRCISERIESARKAKRMMLSYRDLTMDLKNMRVTVDGEKVSLSGNEFKVLQYLLENQGTILTRDQIMKRVWGPDAENENKAVEVYISHIREKIDDVYGKTYIATVRGRGYVIGRDVRGNVIKGQASAL
ncbi:MAG: winged-helix domain-containing protein [Clostridia bacterium]|nr:winged-helix domain-containing protein [Clostridia bacterium]